MNIRVGYVPYLNMAPFYHGFGPEPMEIRERQYEFWNRSPRALGFEAESGRIDAAPLSLVDAIKVESQYQPIANFGIGVKRAAQSVLLFSKKTMPMLENAMIAITDETSTSLLLLQILMEQHYGHKGTRYGRIASVTLFDGEADALLLIGDEALKALQDTIPGFPFVTDLGEEWHRWHSLPFVFARWMVRTAHVEDIKSAVEEYLEKSLKSSELNRYEWASTEAEKRGTSPSQVQAYWDGFIYRLTPEHEKSIELFTRLAAQCSPV